MLVSKPSTALLWVLAASLVAPVTAQTSPAVPALSWQGAGSDLPSDPAWRTGILPNGLRYAVRQAKRPPGSISVRVRIDAGALMENDEQQGWTHLLEHMVFRGTKDFADGEGVKIWQRLGASFGTDTNAFTSLTSTTYVLDLPRSDAASYAQAMKVLAQMMGSATISPAALETERKVVLAERALRLPPIAQKVQAVTNPIMLAGTKAAVRNIIGTDATLSAADADRLRAYYKAWYRPSHAQVIVVGDADPAMLEAEIRRSFGAWHAVGAAPPKPDFGAPTTPPRDAAAVVDPQIAMSVHLAYITRHDERPWTIARQQRQYENWIALAVLNQRLSSEAQKGGALVGAGMTIGASRHIQDQVNLSLRFKPGQWKAALNQATGVLNGALAGPPSQDEIDMQALRIATTLDQQVAGRPTATSPGLANGYVNDIDQGDVSAPETFYRDLFAAQRKTFTPAMVQATVRRLLAPDPRLILYSTTPVEGGDAALTTALAEARKAIAIRERPVRAVSWDELKLPGTPATVTATRRIDDLGVERVTLSNGVEIAMKRTDFEKDRIRVSVSIGHGLIGEAPGDPGLAWTSAQLMRSGVGPFNANELTRVLAGRNISFIAGMTNDALKVDGSSDRQNVADLLKVMTAGVTQMQYRANGIAQFRDEIMANYQSVYSQPGSVLQVFGNPYLFGGDMRFRGYPPRTEIEGLTLSAFRDYWEPRLSAGPIRIVVVGDFDRDQIVDAVAKSFGTLASRIDKGVTAAQRGVRPTPPAASPVTLYHRGDAGQALVARVWPVQGVRADVPSTRAMDVAATIIRTRLTEEFREKQGGSYAPFATTYSPVDLPNYGRLMVGAQLATNRIDDFERVLSAALADLATNGPKPDEFARAKTTMLGGFTRARTENGYWLSALGFDLDDAFEVDLIRQGVATREAVTADQVRAVLARFAGPAQPGFEIRVLPEASTLPPTPVRTTQSD
ncbi:insulinase family protein [Sphingomonas sp. PB1R3]